MKKIRKAVIPAAGFGTRFLPATKATPKEMLPIVDKPTIQYIVEEALQSGIEEILIISGHAKRAIEDHFDTNPGLEMHLESHGQESLLKMVRSISEINIHYIRQKHMRGLGDAILCARSFIDDEPFAVLLGDDVIHTEEGKLTGIGQLIDCYERTGLPTVAVMEVSDGDVPKYANISASARQGSLCRIDKIVEKPKVEQKFSNDAVIGRYVVESDIYDIIRRTPPSPSGEVYFTDALQALAREGRLMGCRFDGKRYDAGNKLEFLQANVEYALRDEALAAPFRGYLLELAEKLKRDKA